MKDFFTWNFSKRFTIIGYLDFADFNIDLVPLPPAHVYGTWGNVLGVFFHQKISNRHKTVLGCKGNLIFVNESSVVS